MGPSDDPIRPANFRARAFLTALLAVWLTTFGGSGLEAGDPKLAQALMEAGKKAFDEGDLDSAFSTFEKAGKEDLMLYEHQYWMGLISEKRGDTVNAIGCYQTFLRNFELHSKGGGSVPPATIPQAKKARARLELIAAGPLEKEKLEDALVEKLMAAATASKATSPEAAKRAARWILRLRREHKGALALLEELGVAPGNPAAGPQEAKVAEPADEPFADVPEVKSGKSLLAHQAWGKITGWTWEKVDERWRVTIDSPTQGTVAWPNLVVASGGRFVYEIEARIVHEHRLDWALGPAFGKRDDFVTVFFQRNQVVATRAAPGKGFADIGGNGLAQALDLKEWHRLTYLVDGTRLKVWLNGTKLLEKDVPFTKDILEGVGIWYQYAKVEVKTLRLGVLP